MGRLHTPLRTFNLAPGARHAATHGSRHEVFFFTWGFGAIQVNSWFKRDLCSRWLHSTSLRRLWLE